MQPSWRSGLYNRITNVREFFLEKEKSPGNFDVTRRLKTQGLNQAGNVLFLFQGQVRRRIRL